MFSVTAFYMSLLEMIHAGKGEKYTLGERLKIIFYCESYSYYSAIFISKNASSSSSLFFNKTLF